VNTIVTRFGRSALVGRNKGSITKLIPWSQETGENNSKSIAKMSDADVKELCKTAIGLFASPLFDVLLYVCLVVTSPTRTFFFCPSSVVLPIFGSANEDELWWVICVSVGFDGRELHISVRPTEYIHELKSKIEAEIGKKGKLFHLEKSIELCDSKNISECISDRSSVLLEIEASFTHEKETLLALRGLAKYGWGKHWMGLETFTEPEQLGTCNGIIVGDGHVVKIVLNEYGLAGLCASMYLVFPAFSKRSFFIFVIFCDWQGSIPAGICLLPKLKDLQFAFNQLTGMTDVASDAHAFSSVIG
jgi:hypothetical protein